MSRWMLFTSLGLLASLHRDDGGPQGRWAAYTARPVPGATVSEGNLSFDGRATVGDFTGTTTTVRGEMTGGSDLTEVRGWVEAPVCTLATGNGKRDKDLNKSMESGRYPTLRFELTGVTPRSEQGDTVRADLQGRFQIHGVEREVTIPATVVVEAGALRVRGTTPLNLKEYRIGGLTKALGVLRMYEGIVVRFDLTFAPRDTGAP